MIEIDGARGEGGGQVLRTALTLSCLTGAPIRVSRIRAGRNPPGLKAQHRTAIAAAARITNARVQGDAVGSLTIEFEPGPVTPGRYRFEVGTAGAATLVLATIVYPLAACEAESTVEIVGGTHVPWSPAWPYLEHVWAWWYAQLGGAVALELGRAGFFPKGGGQVHATIRPAGPSCIEGTLQRGRLEGIEVHSQATAGLAAHVLERQVRGARQELSGRTRDFQGVSRTLEAADAGTCVLALARCTHARLGCADLGKIGKRAEDVGRHAARDLVRVLDEDVPFDDHMADQVLLPMALAKRPFDFAVGRVTGHLATNAAVIASLLPGVEIAVRGSEGEPGAVAIRPTGANPAESPPAV